MSGLAQNPGPIISHREPTLVGAVAPFIWRPPTLEGPSGFPLSFRRFLRLLFLLLFGLKLLTDIRAYVSVSDDDEKVKLAKKKLRSHYKGLRQRAFDASVKRATDKVNSALDVLISQNDPATLAGYYPIGNEISPLPMLHNFLENASKKVGLPVVTGVGQPLVFREYKPDMQLKSGAFGILEPFEQAVILVPECVIIPLLAFDIKGFRLGYGGGFYDRSLQKLRRENPDFLAIGVGYEAQKASDPLPIDKYDQRLDYVVTDSAEYCFIK